MGLKRLAFFSVIIFCLTFSAQNCGKVSIDELASTAPSVLELNAEPKNEDDPIPYPAPVPGHPTLPSNTKVIEFDINKYPNGFSFSLGNQEELTVIKDIKLNEIGDLSVKTSFNNDLSFDPNSLIFLYKPKMGYLGYDQKEIILTTIDETKIRFSLIFMVRSLVLINETNALVYGDDSEDQTALQKKLLNEKPVGSGDIFYKWERVAANQLFTPTSLTSALFVEKTGRDAYCFADNIVVNETTGKYDNIFLPRVTASPCALVKDAQGNNVISTTKSDPGLHCVCSANTTFQAQSWNLLTNPARILSLVNSNQLTGFISPLFFESYSHSAVLQSTHWDDDLIAMIIAQKRIVEDSGVSKNYTLAAIRAHGGISFPGRLSSDPPINWALVYLENGNPKNLIASKEIGISYKNTNPGPMSLANKNDGWSGKSSMVKIVRNKNLIQAWVSDWALSGEPFPTDVNGDSLLSVDLSSLPILEKFIGPQKFGYGSLSQMWSSFNNVQFDSGVSDKYVYDLKKNEVYELQNDGKYLRRKDINPYILLGSPRIIGNPETFKRYRLKEDQSFVLCSDESCLN